MIALAEKTEEGHTRSENDLSTLTTLVAEHKEHLEKIAEHSYHVASELKPLTSLPKHVEKLEEQLCSIQDRLDEGHVARGQQDEEIINQHVSRLESSIEEVSEGVTRVQAEVEQRDERNATLYVPAASFQSHMDEWKQERTELKAEVSSLLSVVQQLQGRVEDLESSDKQKERKEEVIVSAVPQEEDVVEEKGSDDASPPVESVEMIKALVDTQESVLELREIVEHLSTSFSDALSQNATNVEHFSASLEEYAVVVDSFQSVAVSVENLGTKIVELSAERGEFIDRLTNVELYVESRKETEEKDEERGKEVICDENGISSSAHDEVHRDTAVPNPTPTASAEMEELRRSVETTNEVIRSVQDTLVSHQTLIEAHDLKILDLEEKYEAVESDIEIDEDHKASALTPMQQHVGEASPPQTENASPEDGKEMPVIPGHFNESTIERLEGDIEQLKELVAGTQIQVSNLKSTSETSIESLRSDMSQKADVDALMKIQREISEFSVFRGETQSQIEALTKDVGEMTTSQKELQDSLLSSQKEKEKDLEPASSALVVVETHISELTSRLDAVQDEVNELAVAVSSVNVETAAPVDKNQDDVIGVKCEAFEELRDQVDSIDDRVAAMTTTVAGMRGPVATVERITQRLVASENQGRLLDKQVAAILPQLQETSEAVKSLESRVDQDVDRIDEEIASIKEGEKERHEKVADTPIARLQEVETGQTELWESFNDLEYRVAGITSSDPRFLALEKKVLELEDGITTPSGGFVVAESSTVKQQPEEERSSISSGAAEVQTEASMIDTTLHSLDDSVPLKREEDGSHVGHLGECEEKVEEQNVPAEAVVSVDAHVHSSPVADARTSSMQTAVDVTNLELGEDISESIDETLTSLSISPRSNDEDEEDLHAEKKINQVILTASALESEQEVERNSKDEPHKSEQPEPTSASEKAPPKNDTFGVGVDLGGFEFEDDTTNFDDDSFSDLSEDIVSHDVDESDSKTIEQDVPLSTPQEEPSSHESTSLKPPLSVDTHEKKEKDDEDMSAISPVHTPMSDGSLSLSMSDFDDDDLPL